MPLHLLGKKSWNVYNSSNIERVKRDEADAKAREEAEEQRLQEEDAARRTSLLRGEQPSAIVHVEPKQSQSFDENADSHRQHKRRRLRGEDDTDRDLRYAREDLETGRSVASRLSSARRNDTPLVDQDGHIQLVPVPDPEKASKVQRNADTEAEKARKRQEGEDQYTMRFSNAAGFKNSMQAPWYADACEKTKLESALTHLPDRDVWGNEDPRRRQREQSRVSSNDPLAFMQQAQHQLKQSESERKQWYAERTAEMRGFTEDHRKKSKQRHRRRSRSPESPAPYDDSSRRQHRHKHHHRSDRRHSRSRQHV